MCYPNVNEMDNFLFYKEWCRILIECNIEYLKSENLYPVEEVIKEQYRLLDVLNNAYEKKNIITLKRFFKDLTADSMEICSVPKRQMVNARLRAACGEDLTKYDKRLASSVQRIVKRGKIRNGDEYEKVRTYIDVLEGEPEQEALLQELYRLVGDFEDAVREDPSIVGEEWR